MYYADYFLPLFAFSPAYAPLHSFPYCLSVSAKQLPGDYGQFILQYYFSEKIINSNPSDFCIRWNICIWREEGKNVFLLFIIAAHSAVQSGTDLTLI